MRLKNKNFGPITDNEFRFVKTINLMVNENNLCR